MRIIIIGAGSLGLMYAARLAAGGASVAMITRGEKQAIALRDGICLDKADRQSISGPVPAASLDQAGSLLQPSARDWIWLTVKQAHLNDAFMDKLKDSGLLAGEASLLALQNGIGHMERLEAAFPGNPLYAAVTTEGALRVNERHVRYTGHGVITFGKWPKGAEKDRNPQKMLLKTLYAAGIEAELSNDMGNRVYEKLLMNAVINPLTAIYGIRNGALAEDGRLKEEMAALHAETEKILLASGMKADSNSWQRLLQVCKQTAENESSMLRDVKAGRTTEIDWINGGISLIARRQGLPSPLNDAVTTAVKSLSMS
ncbi:ketopantoate reductase family protein [Paenibacillus nasutitermitis]|uniref:2-dehydropantoate 2-reductase n=1 Tax=Paenibacillus nasutitermitis TaxID=1652958 RepID=A0A916Z1C5_9BACL|nr:2-dehydropantoate 2-reductase [Paenibacillus nasutitermitis]GGD71136.1 2-dehydropantoate 2-reductase [Paenibacillus nasutitermitis]